MYQNETSVGNKADQAQPEFASIANRLEQESSKFYNLSNELLRKADSIKRFPAKENNPEQNTQEPNDVVSKMWYEINMISKQNDKLETLLKHLNAII